MENSEAISVLAGVIEQRGYLVINSFHPHRIGDRIPGFDIFDKEIRKLGEINQPCRVMKATGRRDWDEQQTLMHALNSKVAPMGRLGIFYYQIMTD